MKKHPFRPLRFIRSVRAVMPPETRGAIAGLFVLAVIFSSMILIPLLVHWLK